MRKIIVILFTLVSFVACDLNKIEPAQTGAFMKYFGDLGNTEGADLLKLNDGYLLLGNNSVNNTVFLIEVDLKGNTVAGPWTEQNFVGQSVTTDGSSYFIVGDRINTTTPNITELGVLKISTSLSGSATEALLGDPGIPYHGTAILLSSTDDIIVCGYTYGSAASPAPNQSFIFGFDTNLDTSAFWTQTRYTPGILDGNSRVSSRTILENSTGNFVWTTLSNTASGFKLTVLEAERDTDPSSAPNFLDSETLGSEIGDFATANIGGVLVQNVLTPSKEINISTFSTTNPTLPQTSVNISIPGFELIPHAVVQDAASGDFVILAKTNKNRDEDPARTDFDLYITKVGADGKVSESTGFATTFGGTGSEEGVDIVQADDGGYVILGTMRNTNDRDLMVLLKINSNGELIN